MNDELEGSCRGLILRYNPCIHLEGLRINTKNLSQNNRSPADIWFPSLLLFPIVKIGLQQFAWTADTWDIR
jgi:hypothetical protein